jgi:CubicO group peptidase (beta-lactamase class C family)
VAFRAEGAGKVEAVVRDKLFGALHGLSFTLEATGARRIIDFEPVPAPAWGRPSGEAKLTDGEVAARSRALIENGCKAEVFSGVALVAHGDTVLVEQACGEANKRYHALNDLETRINLGSANKMFTEIAVMQLVQAGKVSLTDPLSKYADETWLPHAISDKITVGELIGHTSGLGDFFDDGFVKTSRTLYREVSDYKPLVRTETLAFAPGTKFQYSDTGVLMLGVVIEQASGESYFDYVRRHIYAPAGMTRTDCYPMDEPVEDLAMGYIFDSADPYGWRENTFAHVFRGGPAGGCFSTVHDLYRFAQALRAGKLVSPKTLAWMTTPGLSPDYGQGGFEIASSPAGRIVGHSGIFGGVSVRFRMYVDKDYLVVALSNTDGGGYALGDAIGDVVDQAQ